MTASAATSAGATQAVTISEDSAPITNAPITVPLFWLLLMAASLPWTELGICRSKTPNIAIASTTNRAANRVSTQGWLNAAWTCAPAATATTPAAV